MGHRAHPLLLSAAMLLAALPACAPESREAPEVLWSIDPSARGNPFPSDRLLAGGWAGAPPGYFARMLPADESYAPVRQFLDETVAGLAATGGYPVYAPLLVPLSAPVDPAAVTAVHLYPEDGGADLEVGIGWSDAFQALQITPVRPLRGNTRYVLAIADRRLSASAEFLREATENDQTGTAALAMAAIGRGVAAEVRDLDLVLAFTTQPIADDLSDIQSLIDGPAGDALLPSYEAAAIPEFPIGVFLSTSATFQAVFTQKDAISENIATLAQGTWNAFDYRDSDGVFDADLIAGAVTPDTALVDFRLTVPAGTPPAGGWPVVIVSHGVTGDSTEGLKRGYSFAGAGMAVIGLTAPDHGYRGSALDFFDFSRPLFVRDEFRQSAAEILQIERLLRNANAQAIAPFDELDTSRITYFGNSFGGLLGGAVAAVSTQLDAVGLTVAGGRLVLLFEGETGELLLNLFLQKIQFPTGSPHRDEFVEAVRVLAQWAIDPADPGALAMEGSETLPILLQEALGDATILNESTEALRLAWDVPIVDQPADPFTGRGLLWSWDVDDYPAIETKPHDLYWDLPPMRRQMENFLLSNGTILTAD